MWKIYYHNNEGVFFVVACNDNESFQKAKEFLSTTMIQEESQDAALLVLANKQDLSGATSPFKITEELNIEQYKGKSWLIRGTSALTGQ